MALLRFLAASAAVAAVAGQNFAGGCGYKYGGGAVSYDVSSLASSTADWTWEDPSFDLTVVNYTYTFNICANVNNVPAPCTQTPGLQPPAGPFSAYQWFNNSGGLQTGCYAIGQRVTPGNWVPITSLYDTTDPAAGFQMTYAAAPISGQNVGCPPGVSRTFTLIFRCGYEPFPQPNAPTNPQGTFVTETNVCNYQAYSWTLAGCPKECAVGSNGKLCSGNGICGYDREIQSARCFCDDNYIDADCGSPANPVPSGAIAGAVFGGLLIGAASILGYGYYASRKGAAVAVTDGFYGAP